MVREVIEGNSSQIVGTSSTPEHDSVNHIAPR